MIKKLMFILFLFGSFLMQSQENKFLDSKNQFNDDLSLLKHILNLKVDSIPEDGFSKLLKIKLNSNLENLGDVFAFYAESKELELLRKELSVLENRVLHFADWFVKNESYAIVKSSDKSGIGIQKISEKSVIVLLMGSNDNMTEREKRSDYIYELFSNKVQNLLL